MRTGPKRRAREGAVSPRSRTITGDAVIALLNVRDDHLCIAQTMLVLVVIEDVPDGIFARPSMSLFES